MSVDSTRVTTNVIGWKFSRDQKDFIRVEAPDGDQILCLPLDEWQRVVGILDFDLKSLPAIVREHEDAEFKRQLLVA